MTERISHEEARKAAENCGRLADGTYSLLTAYIDQQESASSDTVSRAEHEAALKSANARWVESINKADEALTAQQAEHERVVGDARRMHYLGNLIRSRSQSEQDELTRLMRKYPPLVEAPAPTPASPSPAVGEASAPAGWGIAGKEPAQPAPGGTELRKVPPVGSVVRYDETGQEVTITEFRETEVVALDVRGDEFRIDPADFFAGKVSLLADPTPAEPQVRPEQAGDRVDQLRADIVEALRKFAVEFGENTPVIGDGLDWVADELERGRS